MAKDVEVKLDIGKAVKILRPRIVAGMERAATWIEGEVKRSFSFSGPSPPGQPPAVDTGRLRSSITHEVREEGNEVIGLVGSNVEYARRLEFGFVGTDKRGRRINQPERPYLRPAVFNNKTEIIKQLEIGAKKGR